MNDRASITVFRDIPILQPSRQVKGVVRPEMGCDLPKLFLSYRREDSAALAGRLFDRLQAHFGREFVFMDVDSIPFGVDFRVHLTGAVGKCDALLAVIGDKWTTISHNGQSRLNDPADFVRIEIEAALARKIPVIPVLVGGMPMPREEMLPPSLRPLVYLNACRLDLGLDFHVHVDRLIRGLEQLEIVKSDSSNKPLAQSAAESGGNLLHLMWDQLDPGLQDAFSLAYNKKRRQGGNRISTKDFFQALARLGDASVGPLIESLPEGALPDPVDPDVSRDGRLVLEESPLLSDCVEDSLEQFRVLENRPRRISPADMFVDIAKHGHGSSVARLRKHGVGEREIEEQVHKLGLSVLRRRGG